MNTQVVTLQSNSRAPKRLENGGMPVPRKKPVEVILPAVTSLPNSRVCVEANNTFTPEEFREIKNPNPKPPPPTDAGAGMIRLKEECWQLGVDDMETCIQACTIGIGVSERAGDEARVLDLKVQRRTVQRALNLFKLAMGICK